MEANSTTLVEQKADEPFETSEERRLCWLREKMEMDEIVASLNRIFNAAS